MLLAFKPHPELKWTAQLHAAVSHVSSYDFIQSFWISSTTLTNSPTPWCTDTPSVWARFKIMNTPARYYITPHLCPSPQRVFRLLLRRSYRALSTLLTDVEQRYPGSVWDSAAAAYSVSVRSEEEDESPAVFGRLSGRIRVPVRLRDRSGPGGGLVWSGLKRPRCPSCRRTDPDWVQPEQTWRCLPTVLINLI